MDRIAFDSMLALQSSHWWYRGRRAILRAAISRLVSPPDGARILEAGCGPGGNLALLSEFGNVDAFDPDSWAVARAGEGHGTARVLEGGLPGAIPVPFDGPYDLIAALDVVEHLDQPVAALAALVSRLGPAGRMLLTVPAYPWMFSSHDRLHHHKRRYTRATLRHDLEQAGLTPLFLGHFNALLLAPAVALRFAQRLFPRLEGGDERHGSSGRVNEMLAIMFAAEAPMVTRLALPIGLSILCIAQKA